MTIKELCKLVGISRATYYWRRQHGLPLLDKPTNRGNRKNSIRLLYHDGVWRSINEIMNIEDITRSQVYYKYIKSNILPIKKGGEIN